MASIQRRKTHDFRCCTQTRSYFIAMHFKRPGFNVAPGKLAAVHHKDGEARSSPVRRFRLLFRCLTWFRDHYRGLQCVITSLPSCIILYCPSYYIKVWYVLNKVTIRTSFSRNMFHSKEPSHKHSHEGICDMGIEPIITSFRIHYCTHRKKRWKGIKPFNLCWFVTELSQFCDVGVKPT